MKPLFSLLFLCVVLNIFSMVPTYSSDSRIDSVFGEKFQEELDDIIDFKIGDKIALDSPKRFLQISILFIIAQNKNYAKITHKKNVSDDDIGTFLNKKRTDFYKKLGITENEYVNYSINYSAEIQEFLETNTQFAEIYEIVQSQVTD